MLIRLATLDDAAAISELIRPLAENYIAHEFSPEGAQNLLASMTPEAIRRYLNAEYRYHVAEAGDGLAGAVATRDNAHLYHLFVAESHQGQGLARTLWETAQRACQEAGHRGDFTVNSSTFAQAVYRKFGFVETGPPQAHKGVISIPMKMSPGS